jgi:hypothetical protein
MVGLCHQRAANTDFRHDYCDIHESLITSFWKVSTYLANIFTSGESETDLRGLVITFFVTHIPYFGSLSFWEQSNRALGARYS